MRQITSLRSLAYKMVCKVSRTLQATSWLKGEISVVKTHSVKTYNDIELKLHVF
jgi:hypothetical protein